MIQLDYFYNTNIYNVSDALQSNLGLLFFDSNSKYGNGLVLNIKANNVKTSMANITVAAHLRSLDTILVVKNFDDLMAFMNNSAANEYLNRHGATERFGDKFIRPYALNNSYTGIKIIQDNVLIIFNKNVIEFVVLFSNKPIAGKGVIGTPDTTVVSQWILTDGTWNDAGLWIDTKFWKD